MFKQFILHPVGVYKDVVGKAILDSQGKPVEHRVFRVSARRVNVMRGENNLLSEEFVIHHEQSAVQELDFVVPENVEYL